MRYAIKELEQRLSKLETAYIEYTESESPDLTSWAVKENREKARDIQQAIDVLKRIMEESCFDEPKQLVDEEEWLYRGCFIQKQEHPQLQKGFCVWKNNVSQTHLAVVSTFKEAKLVCEEHSCFDNHQKF